MKSSRKCFIVMVWQPMECRFAWYSEPRYAKAVVSMGIEATNAKCRTTFIARRIMNERAIGVQVKLW